MSETVLNIKYLLGGAIFTLILLIIGFRVGNSGFQTAPNVTFTTITGKHMAVNELRGRPVIITFWATDCPACIKEIPLLVEWYRRYHEKGLEIIAVAMFYDPPSRVVGMAKAKDLPYDVALDFSAGHARAFGNVDLTPTTFLVDPEGKIIERIISYRCG
ncbi:MAG: peroxiredoxin family protein [Gammaproteobacteria bacterium]